MSPFVVVLIVVDAADKDGVKDGPAWEGDLREDILDGKSHQLKDDAPALALTSVMPETHA